MCQAFDTNAPFLNMQRQPRVWQLYKGRIVLPNLNQIFIKLGAQARHLPITFNLMVGHPKPEFPDRVLQAQAQANIFSWVNGFCKAQAAQGCFATLLRFKLFCHQQKRINLLRFLNSTQIRIDRTQKGASLIKARF